MKKEQIIKSLAVILSVLVSYNFWNILSVFDINSFRVVQNNYLNSFLFQLALCSPVLITSLLLFKKEAIKISGVTASPLKGFGIAAISCLPLFFIYPIFFDLNNEIQGHTIFSKALLSGFFEELIFRTLFFGALYGLLNWKFWPAVLVNAAIFSWAHLYQANDFTSAFLTIFVTAIGAVWFAWLYIRWNYSIWVPMFLHTIMNLTWFLFSVADGTAGGGIVTYVARGLVILISIVLTLRYTSKMQPIHKGGNTTSSPELREQEVSVSSI